jgi:glutathione synthase/RimK-type ligase-like ATP-grasp enzyme
VAALGTRGAEAAVLDTARLPERATLRLALSAAGDWMPALRSAGTDLLGSGFASAWWRRPQPYVLHRSLRGEKEHGAFFAVHAAARALFRAIPALWVNDPTLEEAAEDKPRQLAVAAKLGLAVPRSLVTNDPAAAREFIRERPEGETIHKNVASAASIWRPTGVARLRDRELFPTVRHLPLLFQERIPAEADVRVTVVGRRIFAAEIGYDENPALDWRVDFDRTLMRVVKLPRDIEAKLRRFVGELGLVYAAIDLRRRPDGEHVFLEVNPSGQWLFVERRTGLPITAALAELLARGRP